MISTLNRKFEILDKKPASTPDEITLLRNRFPNIPNEYVKLVSEATELELQAFDNRKKYVRIWGPSGCLEFVDAYEISMHLPEGIPIGDDGSGSCIIYMAGESGWGLYLCDFSVLDRTYAKWIASSLRQFLIDGIGVNAL